MINIPIGGTALVINYYPLIWLNIPGAIAGTYIVYIISSFLVKKGLMLNLDKVGKDSLFVFCIHAIDMRTGLTYFLSLHILWICIIVRCLLVLLTPIIINNQIIRKTFYLK